MTKPQVLFIGDLDKSLEQYQSFKSKFEVLHYRLTSREELIKKLETDFNKISGIYAGWLGFMSIGGCDSSLIQHFPESLKVITIASVGHDQYDSKALELKGIRLYNTPSLGAEGVADTILWHVLESFRFYSRFQTKARESSNTVTSRGFLHNNDWDSKSGQVVDNTKGEWNGEYPFGEIAGVGKFVHSPFGKKVGIVGFGKIGKATGRRLNAIGMEVYYNKRSELSEEEKQELPFKTTFFKEVKELVSIVDVVILSLPGNPSTKGLISREVIDNFKKGGKLINVGRGFLIDNEDYVVDKLESGDLSFFGVDVFDGEPIINKRLSGRDDVSVTPHVGSSTKENFDLTAIFALKNLEVVLEDSGEGESRVV